MEPSVDDVLENRDLISQIFPGEQASLLIANTFDSNKELSWLTTNSGTLFDIYGRYTDVDYMLHLFTTYNSDNFVFFSEYGDGVLERQTEFRDLTVNDLVNVGTIKDLNNPCRLRLSIGEIKLQLMYIEKCNFLLDKYADLREEDQKHSPNF